MKCKIFELRAATTVDNLEQQINEWLSSYQNTTATCEIITMNQIFTPVGSLVVTVFYKDSL